MTQTRDDRDPHSAASAKRQALGSGVCLVLFLGAAAGQFALGDAAVGLLGLAGAAFAAAAAALAMRFASVRRRAAAKGTAAEHAPDPAGQMEAAGRLAGKIAHDVNNLLTAVLAHSGLLSDALEGRDEKLRRMAEAARSAAREAAELNRQLLEFGRASPGETIAGDAASARPQGVPAGPSSGETILVVDDEEMVRELVASQLRRLGYRVIEAANGPSALREIQLGGRIDLVFTDLTMPGGMSGFALAEAARRERPGLRFLFTTGYSDEEAPGGASAAAGQTILHKPYEARELAACVRAALAQGRS